MPYLTAKCGVRTLMRDIRQTGGSSIELDDVVGATPIVCIAVDEQAHEVTGNHAVYVLSA